MLGTNAIIGGLVEESIKLINESLEIRQSMGDRLIDIASGPVDLGMTLTWIGRMIEAKEVRQETLAIYQDQGTDEEIALAHVRLAYSFFHLGEYDEVRKNANVGLTRGRETGNQRAIGLALSMLGSLSFLDQLYDEANQLLEESIATLRKVPGAGEVGWVLSMLAYSEHRRGENEKAQGYLLEAFMMGRGILATITSWIAIPIFAMMLADSGEFERAIELFAFVSRYPMISKSRLVDIFKPSILIAESRLQKENVAEAQARSQARNLRDTIAEIIKELENALDN
jgi:tetratricopeptide (TPR) repeat protein